MGSSLILEQSEYTQRLQIKLNILHGTVNYGYNSNIKVITDHNNKYNSTEKVGNIARIAKM